MKILIQRDRIMEFCMKLFSGCQYHLNCSRSLHSLGILTYHLLFQ